MDFYGNMKNTARKLLSKFGNTTACILYHYDKGSKTITQYKGLGVKLNYETEAIGMNSNIIKAGDAKVICQFDIMPVENTDVIEIEGEKFNVVSSGDTSPNNITKILYTCQVRRGGNG